MTDDAYKRTNDIDSVSALPGANRARDTLDVRVVEGLLDVEADNLSVQEPLDVSGSIVPVQIQNSGLTVTQDSPVTVTASNPLPISASNPLDVSGATVTVTDDGALSINSLPEPLDVSGATVDVSVTNAEAVAGQSPDVTVAGHDLVGAGDIVEEHPVDGTDGLIVSVNSTSDNTLSVSVEWRLSTGGGVVSTDSASDIGISATTGGSTRIDRKGPVAAVTVTDESGATANNANVYIDTY